MMKRVLGAATAVALCAWAGCGEDDSNFSDPSATSTTGSGGATSSAASGGGTTTSTTNAGGGPGAGGSTSSSGGGGSSSTGGAPPAAVCGNAILEGNEACDDGNTATGDGCDDQCAFEGTCPNGVVDPGETCDDGGTDTGDGCDDACQLEAGNDCGDAIDLNDPAEVTLHGRERIYDGTTTASTLTNFGNPTCTGGTGNVEQRLHRYVTQAAGALRISTEKTGSQLDDTTVWVYRDCQDTSVELACDSDDGPFNYSELITEFLPAGTAIFIVVGGDAANDVGEYRLIIEEFGGTLADGAATCAAPNAAGSGYHYADTTGGVDSFDASCNAQDGAPDGVYAFSLDRPSDLVLSALPNNHDVELALTVAACDPTFEILCDGDAPLGGAEQLRLPSAPAGNYFAILDGNAMADDGLHVLNLDILGIKSEGDDCTPGDALNRCAPTTLCAGASGAEKCTTGTTLWSSTFDTDLSDLVITDFNTDGQQWLHCGGGCPANNVTGSASGTGFALVRGFTANAGGEELTTVELDATSHSHVVVDFNHNFDHNVNCFDRAIVEVSTDGTTFAPVATWKRDTGSRHAHVDISSEVAGGTFHVRWSYFDDFMGDGCNAGAWQLDDVTILAD